MAPTGGFGQTTNMSYTLGLVLSCLVLSCLVLSCLVLSCLVLSCLVLSCLVLSCLVGVLANTPGGVKRSGLGAHAVGFLVVY